LNSRTEGWAAGLKMAALSLRGRKDVAGLLTSLGGSQRYIMDYLVEEVLKQQPREVREFLLKTSVLQKLAGPLCDAVVENGGGQDMLTRLEQANLFIVPLDDSRQWYRYHHLFAELLRHQLQVAAGLADVSALHQRASRWYEDHDLLDDAVYHALAARDWGTAIRLASGAAQQRVRRGEEIKVLSWLGAVPDRLLRADLRLYLEYAKALLIAGPPEATEAALDSIEEADRENHNFQGEVAGLRAGLAAGRGDYANAIKLSEKAISLLPPNDPSMRGTTTCFLGGVQLETGRLEEAWTSLTDAHKMALQSSDYFLAAAAGAFFARSRPASRGNPATLSD